MFKLIASALLATLTQQAQQPQQAPPSLAPRVQRDVVYRTVDGVELKLDAYLPADDEVHAAVLLVHGGAWMAGHRLDMREFGELLARRGLACFSVSYRLAPASRYPAQIEDCQYAVQFLRAHATEFHIDPARIGGLGLSAGAHLVSLLGVLDDRRDAAASDPVLHQSSRLQCVVSYFGPSLFEKTRTKGVDTQPPPALFGDGPDTLYALASPLTYVTRDDAPFLLIHGDVDDEVPVEHSRWMDEALRSAGVSSELIVIPGGGHGDFFRKDPLGAYWKRTEAFLAERLEQP